MDTGVRANDPDRIAIDQDFDGEFSAGIIGVDDKAGKSPLVRAVKRRSQLPRRESCSMILLFCASASRHAHPSVQRLDYVIE